MSKQVSAPAAPARPHTLSLDSRKSLLLTGVNEVTSFDDKQLILKTEGGKLTIDGDALHVTSLLLEEGQVAVEGRIDAMVYSSPGGAQRKSFRGFLR